MDKKKCLNPECDKMIESFKYFCNSECEMKHADSMNKGIIDLRGKKVVKKEEATIYN